MKYKILITGGAGYLGSHLVHSLRERCIVYDSLLYANEYFEDVEFVRADVTDYETLKKYLDRTDCVVWLAGIVGDAACSVNARKAIATNVEAVKFLAENFSGKIIYTSSCSAYGRGIEVLNEESPLNALSLYAETKIEAEKYLRDKDGFILRLGTLHGISKRMRFDLVVNVLTMHAIMKKRVEVFGGHQSRPLLSVKDAAQLICRLIDEDLPCGTYNVASENLTILEIAEKVRNCIPDIEVEVISDEFEDKRDYRVDVSKAEKYLGFKAANLTEGSVRDIAGVLRAGRIKNCFELKYANLASLNNLEENKNGS